MTKTKKHKYFMTIGELREIINDLPDDTLMQVYGEHGHVRDAWIDPEDDRLLVICTGKFV